MEQLRHALARPVGLLVEDATAPLIARGGDYRPDAGCAEVLSAVILS